MSNITHLIDDGQCYQTVRKLRWPEGVHVPIGCQSTQVIKRGCGMTRNLHGSAYACHDCDTRFDDLTEQPLFRRTSSAPEGMDLVPLLYGTQCVE